MLVGGAVAWNLVSLRALTVGVAYLNDSSLHEQMVRFATAQLRAGRLPLTSWFAFLGEGSPQFLHYQSLPAIVTGAVGVLVGPDVAFRWSLYLLVSVWPVSVYVAARLLGAGRVGAGASAVMAPFVASVPGVGYEQHAYVWTGYGVWTQLWAMWTLPLAWGYSWRAIRDGRGYLRAVVFIALTVAFHFETGYLALGVLVVWPWVAGRPLRARLGRAAGLLGASLLAVAWVIVPLLAQRPWAAVNEPLQGTGLVNGYGARQVLGWLVSGRLLDSGRLPVLTALAAIGLGLAWLAWSADVDARAVLIALGLCLVLAFGRATFGSLIDVIPGSADVFFRRFMMGVQLAALLLAGRGAAGLATAARRLLRARTERLSRGVIAAVGLAAVVVGLAPAWRALGGDDRTDGAAIAAQQHAERTQGAQLDRLIARIKHDGGGRTYAGMPSDWGQNFTVGAVPVFKYLESRDVDEVGYTLRTASLMTDPEYYFDAQNPSDYQLFAIHYLILPTGDRPPVPATLTLHAGPYALWTLPNPGYIHAGQITGQITANRTNIGTRSIALLHSHLTQHHAYLTVNYEGHGGGRGNSGGGGRLPTITNRSTPGGVVRAQHADLTNGHATATIRMRHPGIAVLSASYDPGWTATVNGHPQPTHMIAPALTAVTIPTGTDHIHFQYHGYTNYPWLLTLSALTLAITALTPLGLQHTRRRRPSATTHGEGHDAEGRPDASAMTRLS